MNQEDILTREQAYSWARARYNQAQIVSAQEIQRLYCAVCQAKEYLFAPEKLTVSQTRAFRELVLRRCNHEPLQHLLKEMYFGSFCLFSSPDAFIVRPETEYLVELALQIEAAQGAQLVADLCAGSGAIALALAHALPSCQVFMVEISEKALGVAKKNLNRYPRQGERIQITCADVADGQLWSKQAGRFDLIVSNPPYVPEGAIEQPEALRDPPLALWGGGENGLLIPTRTVKQAFRLLRPGGVLAMEHDPSQGEQLNSYATGIGFSKARTRRDLTGRNRYLFAKK